MARWVVAGLFSTVVAVTVPLAPSPALAAGAGSVSLTALDVAQSEPFDTLDTFGAENTALPSGWFLDETGSSTRNNDAYAASTGSDAAGDVYSFGPTANTERAFGTLLSGTLTPTIGASFTNNTGAQVTALDVAYTGEQWRLGALPTAGAPVRGPDRLDFQYSLDATSLTTGVWTDADSLDFISPVASPVGEVDGNDANNRAALSSTIAGLAIAPGATFWVRWLDFNVSSSDDGLAVDDFSLTPRVVAIDPNVCGEPATFIHTIQGTGAQADASGVRTIEGVVVGDYQASGQFGGYYVQEEDGDADQNALTSEGIFVFNTSTPVSLGDRVRVRGTVAEFPATAPSLTQLTNVTATAVCATGLSVTPTSISLPVAAVTDLERFEGMRVDITQELTVTEVFTLGRFGEAALSVGGRLDNPTNVVSPGPDAIARQAVNDRSRILLDDGNGQQNIDPTFYPQGSLSASNTLRVGDTLPSLTGVLDHRFSVYRVQPVGPISFTQSNPRTPAPDPVGGNVRAAAFNVLNYFNGNGTGVDGAAGGFPTARGANTLAEFGRQRSKIINAITALDAHVVGLMELENDVTAGAELGAIEDLVAALNVAAGADKWTFVDTGVVGTDAIRVGIIYQHGVVSPVGSHAIIDSTVDARFVDTLNRPSIAQTFELTSNGARFTTVVNHLKSKGSDCDHVGDPDTFDGQGNCNLTRTSAAEALVDWLATDPTGSGDADFLVLGDMNAYAKEEPIAVFEDNGFVNTIAEFLGAHAYSFVFQGQSGYLDHALATASLDAQITGVTEWHINADEPIVLDYNVEFKSPNHVSSLYDPGAYRSSDHDPVLVGMQLNGPATVDAGGPYAVVEGSSVAVSATGSDPDADSLTYAWDLDSNGSFETTGQTATFSAAGIEAPASRTIAVRVSDTEGHTATDTAVVNVIWDFGGFRQGIASPPALNPVKAGGSVSFRFGLSGNQGLSILAGGSPTSTPIACDTRAPIGATEPTASTGSTGLQYSAATGLYTYNWKTTKGWTGCRRFTMTLADGTAHSAEFRFR